jgi:hypothetical protein
MKSLLTACALLTLTLALTGCVKFKQAWKINPDGSGKMTMTMGFSQQVLAQMPEDPFADLDDPTEMIAQEDNGWVAFTRPQVRTEDGYKFATFTGYFEDVSQVTYSGDGGNGDMLPTSYKLEDGTFVVMNPMLGQVVKSMKEDQSMQDPQMRAMMAPMMQGLEMTESYEMPGNVQSAEGYRIDGQTATKTLTDQDLLANEAPNIEGLDDGELAVQFDHAGWNGGEAAWQKELDEAKAQWNQIKDSAAPPAGAGGE